MNKNYDFGSLGITETNKEEYRKVLDYNFEYFVESEYVGEDKVSIEIKYNLNKLIAFEDLNSRTDIFKLQAMQSLVKLVQNSNKLLAINLEEENLYFGQNSDAYQLEKVLDPTRNDENEYTEQIKGLLGSLFMKETSYAIVSSNGELLAKNALLKEMVEIRDLKQLSNKISELIESISTHEQNNLVQVENNFVQKSKQLGRIKTLLILIAIVIIGFLTFIYIPNRTSQLDAIVAYEDKVYEDVLTSLEETKISTMSPVLKYIEAESTIRLSQLSDTQKENILYNLSPSVQDGILDFWVYVGQNQLEKAYDQSIKNNDAQQKAYVLLLLIDDVQNDTDLKTDEKDTLLGQYQGELDSITSAMEAADEEDKEE